MNPFATFFLLLWCVILSGAEGALSAESIKGSLDSVIKGDTITIMHKGKKVDVRLFGIDSPEKTQAFGQTARNFTGGKASKGEIRVDPVTNDHEGRVVAMVYVNGVNLNELILSQGYGWVVRQDCKENFCADWLKLESNARSARKGLWADDNPTPPWEYRKNKRSEGEEMKGLELATVTPAKARTAPDLFRHNKQNAGEDWKGLEWADIPVVGGKLASEPFRHNKRSGGEERKGPAPAAVPATSTKIVSSGPAPYHGDTKTRIFHSSTCKEFACPTCTLNFYSISDALDAGYRPHFECLTK